MHRTDAALIEEAEAACHRLREDRRRPALWDVRRLAASRPNAWVSFITGAPNNLLAVAVVAGTDQLEILGAFPDLIDRLLHPFRVFSDESEALDWLRDYV